MSTDLAASGARGAAGGTKPVLRSTRRLRPRDRDELFEWLDDGLRDGRRGRLRGEYAAILEDESTLHVVARSGGRLASHVMARVVEARAGAVEWRLGLIGLVYTDPIFRRRGLAGRCLEQAASELRARGAGLAVLWSDREPFYAQQGYHRAGRERLIVFDSEVCSRAAGSMPETVPRRSREAARSPEAADWAGLDLLYASKSARVCRAPGAIRALASAPDCRVVVSGPVGRPDAYAALGKGDDFAGVVHEWAGDALGVTACLSLLVRGRGELVMIAGPVDEAPVRALRLAGASTFEGGLGLLRPLHVEALWAALPDDAVGSATLRDVGDGYELRDGDSRVLLDARELLELLLGRSVPNAVIAALGDAACSRLARALPVPIFLWGFDSI